MSIDLSPMIYMFFMR